MSRQSVRRPRFALRTIHGGLVRIGGVTYRPDGRFTPYDGRLDGQRFAFGLYYVGEQRNEDFVCMWGSELAYRSDDPEADWPGAECVDGTFPWLWWDRVDADAQGTSRGRSE